MTRSWHPDDDELFTELSAAVRETSTPPDSFVQAAKAAYTWRSIDEELELLSLSFDSSLVHDAGVRAPATRDRMLVFENEELTLTLEVDGQVVMGQVIPPHADRITLEAADGSVDETEADDSGFFLLRRPAAGPVRVKWRGESNGVTEWVSL